MAEELPALQEGLLDEAQVRALFADLAARVQLLEVFTKGGEEQRADTAPITLEQARDRLLSCAVHGVQVRYLHKGREWCDTFLRTPDGVRLVRMEAVAPPG